MRATLRYLTLGAGALAASLLLALVHPLGNAHIYSGAHPPSQLDPASFPPDVRAVLQPKCADCHSAPDHPLFYGHLAPASWLMESDILRARRKLDLSQWSALSAPDRQAAQAKILSQAKHHSMPPWQYLLIHWGTSVNDADIQVLSKWVEASAGPASGQALAGDAGRGHTVFEKRCTGCHNLDRDREGPRLKNVFGRPSASVPGYDYSAPLKSAHIVWDETNLDRWLANPDAMFPNNNMDFFLKDPQDRADVIQFLKSLGH